MKKIILANADYSKNTTDEGEQLQEGLRLAGWTLCGYGYDGERDIKQILKKYKPDIILISDVRDLDPSKGGFDKNVYFTNYEALKYYNGFKIMVYKDAGSLIEFQKQKAELMGVNALLTYYHFNAVSKIAPWTDKYTLFRTYHTIDNKLKVWDEPNTNNGKTLLSGALNMQVYPVRYAFNMFASRLGIDTLQHPGYGNQGAKNIQYYGLLKRYDTAIMTCSAYNFALRKIIEGVCCGINTLTNLPKWDILPVIDKDIIRFNTPLILNEEALKKALNTPRKSEKERQEAKEKALIYYDFRAQGKRLDKLIERGYRDEL